MISDNPNPEQLARVKVDTLLIHIPWLLQSFKQRNIAAAVAVAIRQYRRDTEPANHILLVNRKPSGFIDEITALQVFYAQPYQRRGLSYAIIRDLVETIKNQQAHIGAIECMAGLRTTREGKRAGKKRTHCTSILGAYYKRSRYHPYQFR